jgi:predicted NACHT family NTPase
MTLPNSLSEIVTRINQGSLTEADLQALSQIIGSAIAQGDRAVAISGDAQAATITTGDGNLVLNIVFQADGLQIAGKAMQGQAVETLRQLLQGGLAAIEIDWQQVSRSLLNEQIQRLTTNPLTHAEGIAYRTEQVYVPLGLVERKKVARRGEDVSPEQGSLLYEETEITRKFEHEDFLEQVLQGGQSPRSGGRRIAVIGEPGAGKTTLLQQMARWVAENIEGAIVVWVSLADLQGRLVEDYLLEQWLLSAVQQQGRAEVSMLVKDAFVAQVNVGRVWLLMDGVDEMPVVAGSPLGEMERQVRLGGLLGQARMVLTCRLNLWDGDRHALDTFDVYRTLEFAYPRQVEQFVGQWFRALPEAQLGQAEKLCGALRQPGKERLRDLVKNPLRLTLLCFNWYLGEGTLPETKAGLYEQFVADFYEWKRERFPTTAEHRGRLNAALGKLAREAIDKEETRFRLRHDFVC